MKVNELFCRECVEQIYVPDVVRVDLLSIIEEKLKKAGFYYRIAYRVKAVDSTVDKLQFKDYRRPGTENEDKKMQDLIGIRIILWMMYQYAAVFWTHYLQLPVCGRRQKQMNMNLKR